MNVANKCSGRSYKCNASKVCPRKHDRGNNNGCFKKKKLKIQQHRTFKLLNEAGITWKEVLDLTFCLLLRPASTFIVCVLSSSSPATDSPPSLKGATFTHLRSIKSGFPRRSDLIVRDWKLLPVRHNHRVSRTPTPHWVPSIHTPRLFCLPACKMGQTPPPQIPGRWSLCECPLVATHDIPAVGFSSPQLKNISPPNLSS